MRRPPFEEVLRCLRTHEGAVFRAIAGKDFTYRIHGGLFRTSRTRDPVGLPGVERAYRLPPFPNPRAFPAGEEGASYVWAVLLDPRIRRLDW